MRPLWRQYSNDADAVIFVVDASDMPRMRLAADELSKLYHHTVRRSIHADRPLLILANKQDAPDAATKEVVHQVLKVSALPVEICDIFPCAANDRQSLLKGIQWLTTQLKAKNPIPSVEQQ